MRIHRLLALAAACALSAPGYAAVDVKFIEPDKFTDLPFSPSERATALATLQQHFEKIGSTLPLSDNLKIEVIDVDLAGREEPDFRHGRALRILRGQADWPAMQLRYALESGGKVVKSGEARINSMNYLRQHNRYFPNEPLRYEKAMVDAWFRDLTR